MLATNTSRRAVMLIFALVATASIAACDATATAPALSRATGVHAAIEGDTLECGNRGWVVVDGRYVCNQQ